MNRRQHRLAGRVRFAVRPVCLAVCLAHAGGASALPTGATTVHGQVQVQPGTSAGQMLITQGSAQAALNWQSFSIGLGERVRIVQPGASSILFNRVTGQDPSVLLGQLQANGRVFLSNPRGIVFGREAQVDVGGLVATTLNIAERADAAGRFQLTKGLETPGSIVADGTINAPGGTVALVAPTLSVGGTINAGRAGLAAASEVLVDVEGDGLIFFNARNDGLDTRLALTGSLLADGGTADLRAVARGSFADTVLNLDGIVRARSIGSREGRIFIDGGGEGITRIGGTLDASGVAAGERGGDVLVQGNKVLVDRGALIDASASAGGGSVRVGGDFQGKNPDVANAQMVTVMPGARLDASAADLGDAGRVIVWSDLATRFYGQADARGGAAGGNGGLVEVSGKSFLEYLGHSDRSAPLGLAGRLLLDPLNLTIGATADFNGDATTGDDLPALGGSRTLAFNAPSLTANSRITAAQVVTELGNGDVALQAANNIIVSSPISGGNPNNSLRLSAGNDVIVNQPITLAGPGRNLVLEANVNFGVTAPASGTGSVTVAAGANLSATGTITIANAGSSLANQLGADINANALISAQALNLSGPTQWTLTGATNITGNITGLAAGTLTKAGAGALTLSGTNSFAGATAINAGSIVATGSSIGDTSAVTVGAAGTLTLTGNETIGSLAGSGAVALAVNTLSAGGDNSATLWSGTTTGTGGLSKQGTGTMSISSLQGYTGPTNIATGGRLELTGATGGLAAASVVTADGTLAFSRSADLAFANNIGGSGGVTQAGPNKVTLSGTNTYAGTTAITGGVLEVSAAGALPAGTVVQLSDTAGAALSVLASRSIGSLAGGGAAGGNVTLANGVVLTAGNATDTSFGGVIGGGDAASGLTKIGAGVLTLTNNSTYTGPTLVNDGTLQLSGATARVGNGTGAITIAANKTLDLIGTASVPNPVTSNGGVVASSGGGGTLAGPLTLGTASTVSATGASTLQISGAIGDGGSALGLAKQGTGTVLLSGANTYTGTTVVNLGTLALSGGAAIADTGAVTLANVAGATLNVQASEAIGSLAGGGTTGGNVTLGNGVVLTTGGNNASTSFAGAISGGNGSSGLTKAGTGVLTLSGTNSYAGPTQIVDGTLRASGGSAIGDGSAVTLANLATAVLDVQASETIGSLAGGGATGGNVTLGNGVVLTAGGNNTSTAYGGVIGGGDAGSGLTKDGTGVLTLSRTSTYAGTTAISDGTLRLDGATAGVGNGAGTITIASGKTLDLVNAAALANPVTSTGGVLASSAGGGTFSGALTLAANSRVSATGGTLEVSGAVGDGGGAFGLTKEGTGTVRLSGTNTYTGATAVNQGTLVLAGGAAIADNASVAMADVLGATLQVTASEAIGSLSGGGATGGNVTLGNGVVLGVGGDNTPTSFGGVISGGDATSGLTKTGTAVLTLTNNSTYTGPTLVNDGTLQLSGATARVGNGTGAITIAANKTLDLIGTASVPNPVTSNGGVLASSSGGGTLAGALTLGAASTVSATGASTLQVSGAIGDGGGAFGLSKQGTGTVLLSGTNTYTGTTAVNQGTLALSGGAAIADTGAVTLANVAGATLNVQASEAIGSLAGGGTTGGNVTLGNGVVLTTGGNNASTSFAGAISGGNGSSGLTKAGTGVLTLSGTNSYAGPTQIVDGTLRASGGSAIGDGSAVTLANLATAVLDVQASETIGSLAGGGAAGGDVTLGNGVVLTAGGNNASTSFAGVISGGNASSGLSKAGTGVLTLSGVSTYTGPTAIDNGTLQLDGVAALVGNGTGVITIAAGKTLDLINSPVVSNPNPVTSNGGVITSSTGGGVVSGAVTLGANSTVSATGGTLKLAGAVGDGGGAFGLAKEGTGTVLLSGNNSYTGATAVNQGTLALAGGAAIANTGAVTLANAAGVVLDVQASEAIGALSGGGTTGGNVTLNANTLTVNGGGTFAGAINGAAGSTLAKGATGTLILSGANGYDATTIASGGTLQVGNNGTTGTLGTGDVTNDGTLVFNRSDTPGPFNVTNNIGGGGVLRQAGSGVLRLSGINTYTGETQLNAGVVAINSATPFGTSSGITFDGGALRADANGINLTSPVTLNAPGGGTINTNSNNLTLSGAITGAGALTKIGTGDLALSNTANAYAGGTNLNDGTLTTTAADVLPNTGTVAVAAGVGRTLTIGGNDRVASLTLGAGSTLAGTGFTLTVTADSVTLPGVTVDANLGAATLTVTGSSNLNGSSNASTVNIGAATLTLGSANRLAGTPALNLQNATSVLTLGGAEAVASLDGVAGSTASLGANTLTVNGGGTFAGAINGAVGSTLAKGATGTLVLSADNVYGTTTIANGGTLQIGANGTTGTLGAGNVTNDGTLVFNRSDTPGPFNVTNNIGGGGVLRQAGSGVLRLSGINTYTGETQLNAGVVAINSATPFGTSSGITFDGGALRADANGINLTSPVTLNAPGGGTINTNSNNLTLSGPITGAGALTKIGAGDLALSNTANAYAGGTNLNDGTLTTTAADVLPDTGTVAVAAGVGRTLTIGGNDTVGSLTLGAGSTLAGTGFTLTAADNSVTLPGVTVGANLGAATLTVTASSTLSGSSTATTVNVNAGTLTLGAAERLADAAAVNLSSATSALVLGGAEAIGSLAGIAGSAVTLGANTLTTGGNGGTTTFAGVISGAGGLTKAGAGVMTLSADNTYAGTTTVSDGTLALAAGGNRLLDAGAVVVNAGTLSLAAAETIGSLAGTGGTVALGANTLTTGGNNAATQYLGNITGTAAAALVKNGSGTLTLGGTNTYAGGTTVNAGGLATTGSGNPLADGGALVLAGGTSFTLGGSETIGSLSGAGNVTLGSFTLTTGGNNTSTQFDGAASGTGGLTKAGSGIFTLGGVNTYSGATTVDGGTLATLAGGNHIGDASAVVLNAGALSLGSSETIGSLAGAAGTTVALGGNTLTAGGNNGSTQFDGIASGAGGLTKAGTGIFTLGGVNDYSGVTTLNGGTLATTAGGSRIADTGAVVINAGTLALGGAETIGSLAGAAGTSVTLAGTLTTGGNDGSTAYLGAISGNGGLTKLGTGNFTLGGSNVYDGATTVNAGRLTLAASDVLPNGTAVSVAAGARLDLGAFNDQVGSLSLAGTLDGTGKLSALTYDLQDASVNANLGGGTLTQAGGNSTLNGSTDAATVAVNAGTLALGAAGRFTAAPAVTVQANATLQLAGDETTGSLTLAGTAGNVATLSGVGTLTATGPLGYDLTDGVVDANLGTGPLTSRGASLLNGTAAVGSVAVANGSLTMGSANRLTAQPSLDVAAGASFVLNGDETVSALTGAGTVTLGSTLTIGAADATSLFDGVIDGIGDLLKTGTGTITLAGSNAYIGTTRIAAGTLATAAAQRLPDGTALTVDAGATLALGGDETIGSLAGAGGVALNAFTLTTGGDGTSTRFDGVASGTGGLTKAGAGTLTLAGANSYTGATTVNVGILATTAADRIADASAVTLAAGATLSLGGSDTVGSLAGAGSLLLNASTLTAGGDDTSTTFSGVASGTGGLTKAGAGMLTLAGANTYTGATTVNAGTLATSAADRIADASATTVAAGAMLALGGNETIGSLAGAGNVTLGAATLTAGGDTTSTAFTGVIAGTGGLTKAGSGTLSLGGANTYTGATNVNAGTLATTAAERIADASATTVAAGATLTLGGDETIGSLAGAGNVGLNAFTLTAGGDGSTTTFSGVASGTGGLTKAGAGTLTLAGANTYTGATTVNAGTLATSAADRIADASATTVAAGATLALGGNETIGSLAGAGNVTLGAATLTAGGDNTSTAFTGVIAGTGGLTKAGSGTLSLGGANTYTGATNVNAGTLATTAAERIADASATTVAAGATLTLGGDETIGSLAGAGVVAVNAFTLTAGGDNTTTAFDGVVAGSGGVTKAGTGRLTLGGVNTYTGTTTLNGGTLATGADERIADASALVIGGGTFSLGGNETLASLAGGGSVALNAFALTVGASAVDTTYAGNLGGNGGSLVKQGAGTLTLTGTNSYTGGTTVAAGTLVGNTASLQGNIVDNAALVFDQAADSSYAGVVSGSGTLAKRGAGTLTLGAAQTYTGATDVAAGTLNTGAADRLSDATAVTVAAAGRLVLGGAETLASIVADGPVSIAGSVTTAGEQSYNAALTSTGSAAYTLTGTTIRAEDAGNRLGSELVSIQAGTAVLSAGTAGDTSNDLKLGTVNLSGGGRVEAGNVLFGGDVTLTGGTFSVVANALPTYPAAFADADNKPRSVPGGARLAFASNVIDQADTGSRIVVGSGATLSLQATQFGSIRLGNTANDLSGGIVALSGPAIDTPWRRNIQPVSGWSGQGHVDIAGAGILVGRPSIEADVVTLHLDSLATLPAAGADAGSRIVARLPYDNVQGTDVSHPGLTLALSDASLTSLDLFPFGAPNEGQIRVEVGAIGPGAVDNVWNAGFLQARPTNKDTGTKAVYVSGPLSSSGGYRFFYDGSGKQSVIPVIYNGLLPLTPQKAGALSAVQSVSEKARKDRFEEAVRTENVAVRLRSGVIAEVGPGRPATTGSEGAKQPETCSPTGATLSCGTPP